VVDEIGHDKEAGDSGLKILACWINTPLVLRFSFVVSFTWVCVFPFPLKSFI